MALAGWLNLINCRISRAVDRQREWVMSREEHPWNCHIRSIYGDALDKHPRINESIPNSSLDKLGM